MAETTETQAAKPSRLKKLITSPVFWVCSAIVIYMLGCLVFIAVDTAHENRFERRCVLSQGKIVEISEQNYCQDASGKIVFSED